MKNILNWFLRNLPSIIILVIIIVVIILIDVYGTDISSNSVNVILAIAAGTSTFFLYLAFRESKKNNIIIQQQNKILMSQSKYNDFKSEIKELKEEGSELLFSEWELKFINNKYQTGLPETNYINFFYVIYTFHHLILNDRYYQKYLKELADYKTPLVDANDIFDVENLVQLLTILKGKFVIERYWIKRIYDKYYRIFTSEFLTLPYRKELFIELDEICEDFFKYCNDISNDENNIKQLGLQKNEDGTIMILLIKEYSELVMRLNNMIIDLKNQLNALKE